MGHFRNELLRVEYHDMVHAMEDSVSPSNPNKPIKFSLWSYVLLGYFVYELFQRIRFGLQGGDWGLSWYHYAIIVFIGLAAITIWAIARHKIWAKRLYTYYRIAEYVMILLSAIMFLSFLSIIS